MAIDFPNTPTLNQIYNNGGKSWRWDGAAWLLIASEVEVNVELSVTNLDGGTPETIQFYQMSAVDAGGV